MSLGDVHIMIFYGRPEKVSLTKNVRDRDRWFNTHY